MVWRGRLGARRGFSLGAIFVGYGWLSACAGRSVETPNAGGNGGSGPSGGSSGAAGSGALGGRGVSNLNDDCGYGRMRAVDFHCQSAADECNGDSDCSGWAQCLHDGARFACYSCDI
jgi:hypothetical protein